MTSQPSTPFTRAFAGKRNKMTAADVRKHVMTGSLLVHPGSFDSADGTPANVRVSQPFVTKGVQIRLLDVVEPCDIEEVLAQRKTSAFYDISSSCSSPRKVSEFPSDDVELRIVPRETHTVEPLPYDIKDLTIEPHVHDILLSFMDEFALVEKRYQQFGSADAYLRMTIERPIVVKSTTRALFEMDGARTERVNRSASLVVDHDTLPKRHSFTSTVSSGTMGSNDGDVREQHLSHSVSDPAVSGITQRVNLLQLDQTNDSKRLTNRHTNLVNLLPLQAKADVVEKRTAPQYPDEVNSQKLIIKVLKLDLQPLFEPIFGSMTIYDSKARRKVTETFHFDVNPSEFDLFTGKGLDPLGLCNQATFNLAGPLSDLFLVIRLSKILQACDVADGCEPYLGPKDDRTVEKLHSIAAENASRLGSHRMPLGFMIVDLQKLLTSPNNGNVLTRADSMIASQMSGNEGLFGSSCGDITMASVEDANSIVSADRVSLSSTATFRRIGSGTSAATVLNRVRTPLTKRKFLGGDDSSSTSAIQEQSQFEINLGTLKPMTLTINSFFRQEADRLGSEDLYKLLGEARKQGGRLSKMKTFPANLTLQLSGGTGEELLMRLNPDYRKMPPFINGPESELTKDIQAFPAPGQYAVNTGYKNLLYVYPKCVNFSARQGTARNICIKMELMNAKEAAQTVVFPHEAVSRLDDHIYSSVLYHSKTPTFCDEFKMRIPLEVDDGFHILFTFYHISCKAGSRDEEVKYPIGYSWLPLYRAGHLESGDFTLPICLEKPPPSYGYLSPDGALPNIKWLDSHKPLFNVTLKAISTVHPQDDYLEKFFVAVSSLASNDRRCPPINEQGLTSAIQGILKARPEPMVSFLYNVLDKLISLIARPPYSSAVSTVCFETLGQLVKICTHLLDSSSDAHGRSGLLISYIHYFKIALKESKEQSTLCKEIGRERQKPGSPETQKLFNIIEDVEKSTTRKGSVESTLSAPNKTVHEEIVELWVKSGGQTREMAFINCWFFLELMMKSMAEYLSMTGRLYLVRRSRFSERFIKNLDSLSAAISVEVVTRMNKGPFQAQSVASSWAFFLRDAFSIVDRSYVMGLVRDFNQTISLKICSATEANISSLMMLKQDFMRIVCSHEHFVIMNVPFSHNGMSTSTSGCIPPPSQLQPPSPGGGSLSGRSVESGSSYCSGELSIEYRRSHFLLGIVLGDLSSILDSSPNATLQAKAIGTIRNLLATHEADSRLAETGVRARVAALYLPLISIIMDNVGRLHDPYERQGSEKRNFLTERFTTTPGMNPKLALAIAGIGNSSPPSSLTSEEKQKPTKSRLNLEMSKQLLVCFCWVLKHLDQSLLRNWVRELPPNRLTQLLDALQLCVSCFEYKGKRDDCLKEESGPEASVRWRRDVLIGDEDELILEGALCTEVTLCVLDVLETIVRVISMPGSDHLLFSLSSILREIMHMLACNQSVQALDSIFSSQRALIIKYPELVFEQETEQCGELCLQLLRHCASTISSVRSQAAASIYLLMRESFETGNSLARVKMQITMSLSTLVSIGTRNGSWLNEDCLRRSLKTILNYAEADSHTDVQRLNACFTEQVRDLVFNLHMILSDTVKMKEYANDFEMTLDLMYRIAKGYQNNPDLRLTWLLNMASRHADKSLHSEAAQCMLHASALAAEYIAMTTTDGNMPPGAAAFSRVSENIHEESAVSDDVVSPETDGICESRHFTAGGLIQLVEKTASLLEKAQMYELLPNLFKIIEPVLSEWRDYRSLSSIHARISEALSKIEPSLSIVEDTADAWLSPLRSSDKRCFGTYFRVGFYGTRFADLDGEEFIYKEAPFTKLSEISHRLELFYTERFGKDVVEVIKDSNNVTRSNHLTNKAYLQITYVEPHWDKWERRRRQTHFERSHGVKRFVYATPFTKDGKAHGDLKDQYKRRTILTTQNSFPYVKTRIRVVEKEQKILLPIQVAIEDIEKKTRELSAAVSQIPADAKMLQMVLQGCIGTTVNQGPAEIANVFLTDVLLDERGKPVDKMQNKLRLAFRDFSKRCSDALALNKQLIQHDQLAYQNELQKNYVEFTRRMAPMMGGKRPPPSSASADDIFDLRGPVTAV